MSWCRPFFVLVGAQQKMSVCACRLLGQLVNKVLWVCFNFLWLSIRKCPFDPRLIWPSAVSWSSDAVPFHLLLLYVVYSASVYPQLIDSWACKDLRWFPSLVFRVQKKQIKYYQNVHLVHLSDPLRFLPSLPRPELVGSVTFHAVPWLPIRRGVGRASNRPANEAVPLPWGFRQFILRPNASPCTQKSDSNRPVRVSLKIGLKFVELLACSSWTLARVQWPDQIQCPASEPTSWILCHLCHRTISHWPIGCRPKQG